MQAKPGVSSNCARVVQAAGALLLLSTIAPPAWSLPVTLGRDDWFTFSGVQTTLAPAPLVDFTSGSTANGGRTLSSAERYINDPFARPNTPEFSSLSNWLSVVPRASSTFSSEYSQASLGAGAARGFGRLGWGDGQNTVTLTAAIGDIVTVTPGGSLNVGVGYSGAFAATTERVTPQGSFDTRDPAALEAATTLFNMGGDCEAVLGPFAVCLGPDHFLGVGAQITTTLAVWQYDSQLESPFSRFGVGTGLDCAGSVICQVLSSHQSVGTPLGDGTDEGSGRSSYLDTFGFFGASVPSSLSTGGGGKYYVGAQLSILLAPEVSEWGTLAGCLAGPWSHSLVPVTDVVCRPQEIEPGLAFDMSRSLNIGFSGDAQYTSQSGVFLSGNDVLSVPEPGTLVLLGVAWVRLAYVWRRKSETPRSGSPLRLPS